MKKVFFALAALCAVPAFAQTSVGVSIGIQQPGIYGRIDIGNYPEPVVVNPQPVIVQPSRVSAYQRPIYLYVPPQHQQDWRRYCARYSACGQPVYFVREDWVRDRWEHEHGRDHDRGRSEEHERGHRDHDRGEDRRDRDRGRD